MKVNSSFASKGQERGEEAHERLALRLPPMLGPKLQDTNIYNKKQSSAIQQDYEYRSNMGATNKTPPSCTGGGRYTTTLSHVELDEIVGCEEI